MKVPHDPSAVQRTAPSPAAPPPPITDPAIARYELDGEAITLDELLVRGTDDEETLADLLDDADRAAIANLEPGEEVRIDLGAHGVTVVRRERAPVWLPRGTASGGRPAAETDPALTPALAAWAFTVLAHIEVNLAGDTLTAHGLHNYARCWGADVAIVQHARARRHAQRYSWHREIRALVRAADKVLAEHAVDPGGLAVLDVAAAALDGVYGDHAAACERVYDLLGLNIGDPGHVAEHVPFGALLVAALGALPGAKGMSADDCGPTPALSIRDVLLARGIGGAMEALHPTADRAALASALVASFVERLEMPLEYDPAAAEGLSIEDRILWWRA